MNNTFEQLLNTGQVNATGPGTALSNSTALTDITPGGSSGGQAFTISPASLQQGMVLRTTVNGIYSTSSSGPSLSVGLYYGGVAGTLLGGVSSLFLLGTGAVTNFPWEMKTLTRVESVGTSGSVRTLGSCLFLNNFGSGNQNASVTIPNISTSTGGLVTVDTSVSKIMTVGAQWSAASTSNSIQVVMFTVELLNQGIA